MVWVIIISVVLFAIAFAIGLRGNKKLVNEGQIVNRKTDFMYDTQCYTMKLVEDKAVMDAIRNSMYSGMGVNISAVKTNGIAFSGGDWSAEFFLDSKNENSVTWKLRFTNFVQGRYGAAGGLGMNKLTTLIEKTLYSLDPNVVLRTEKTSYSSKRSLF